MWDDRAWVRDPVCVSSAVHGFHPYMNHQYSQIGIKSHIAHWALRAVDCKEQGRAYTYHTHLHVHDWKRGDIHAHVEWQTERQSSTKLENNIRASKRCRHPVSSNVTLGRLAYWVYWEYKSYWAQDWSIDWRRQHGWVMPLSVEVCQRVWHPTRKHRNRLFLIPTVLSPRQLDFHRCSSWLMTIMTKLPRCTMYKILPKNLKNFNLLTFSHWHFLEGAVAERHFLITAHACPFPFIYYPVLNLIFYLHQKFIILVPAPQLSKERKKETDPGADI